MAEQGERGERGPMGDHGQAGDAGAIGARGKPGEQGPPGPRFSSLLTRHLVLAYVLLWMGVLGTAALSGTFYGRTLDEIAERAVAQCEASNLRSDVQRDDYAESARQVQTLDIENLFGIDSAAAAEFRRLSAANTVRRIASLPYFDCATGKRLPPPPAPVIAPVIATPTTTTP